MLVRIVPDKLQALLAELAECTDFDERADYLIETASRFKEVPAALAVRPFPPERRVPGCESEVYCWLEPLPSGSAAFHFAVENPQGLSAKAFAVILSDTLSGQELDQVVVVPDEITLEIFGSGLSLGKGLGLISMLRMVKALAAQELSQQQQPRCQPHSHPRAA